MKILYCIPFFLYACGSDTPSFVEIPEGVITLSVNETASETDEESFQVDDSNGADAIAYSGEESEEAFSDDLLASNTKDGDEVDAGSDGSSGSNGGSSGSNGGSSGSNGGSGGGSNGSSDSSIASSGSNGSSTGSSTSSSSQTASNTSSSSDIVTTQTVAKACAPYFKGLAQKIKVVDADKSQLNLSIAPDTAIAFKVAGNQTKLTINLPAGNNIPGVCFFVSGHQAKVTFSSASLVSGFTYIGRGDQSSGSIAFLGGSPAQAHVELKGNNPTLKVQGLDSDLCSQERLQCSP